MVLRYFWRSDVPGWIAGLLLGLAVFAMGALGAVHQMQLAGDLDDGEGTVIAVTPPSGKSDATVLLAFHDRGGVARSKTLWVSRTEWTNYRPGRKVPLVVSAADGGQAWTRDEPLPSPAEALVMALAGLVAGAVCMAKGVRDVRRTRVRIRVLRTGIPVPGRIARIARRRRNTLHWAATYAWTVGEREYRATSPILRGREAERFREGEELEVLVDPADPANGEIDWFGYRPASR